MRFAIAMSLSLAACEPVTNDIENTRIGVKAPRGTVTVSDAVDGLIVGHRLMASGEYELAIKAYNRSISENGVTADVLSALGSANLQLQRLGQAETLLRAAVEKDKDFAPAWNNLGVVLANTDQNEEAAVVFRIAFGLDKGKSEEIRMNLTRALAKIENKDYIGEQQNEEFELVRRGNGRFLLLQTPKSNE